LFRDEDVWVCGCFVLFYFIFNFFQKGITSIRHWQKPRGFCPPIRN